MIASLGRREAGDEVHRRRGAGHGLIRQGAELEALINPGSVTAEMDISLAPPEDGSRVIATLDGKLSVLIPGGIEEFRFGPIDPRREKSERRGGVIVTLEGMRKNNDLWEARLRVAFDDASGPLESHRSWIYDNEAFLLAADGTYARLHRIQFTHAAEKAAENAEALTRS